MHLLRILLLALAMLLPSCAGLDAQLTKLDFRISPTADLCGNYTAQDGQVWEVCYNPLSKVYSARYGGLLGRTYLLTYDPRTKALTGHLPDGGRIQFADKRITILPPDPGPVPVQAAK